MSLHETAGSYFATALFTILRALARLKFCHKLFDRPAFTFAELLSALCNVSLYFGVLQLQVIFKFGGIHNPDNGNAVFLQDKVFLVQMNPFRQSAKISSGLSDWDGVDDGIAPISQDHLD